MLISVVSVSVLITKYDIHRGLGHDGYMVFIHSMVNLIILSMQVSASNGDMVSNVTPLLVAWIPRLLSPISRTVADTAGRGDTS